MKILWILVRAFLLVVVVVLMLSATVIWWDVYMANSPNGDVLRFATVAAILFTGCVAAVVVADCGSEDTK